MVDLQVILDYGDLFPLTLLLEIHEEVTELVSIVADLKDLEVDEAPLLADGTNDGDGVAPALQHSQLHPTSKPAL